MSHRDYLQATWEMLRKPGSQMTLDEALRVPALAAVIKAYSKAAANAKPRPFDAKQRQAGDTDLFQEPR
jgi:hypothetical protein